MKTKKTKLRRCLYCRKIFEVTLSLKIRKYCSRICFRQHQLRKTEMSLWKKVPNRCNYNTILRQEYGRSDDDD